MADQDKDILPLISTPNTTSLSVIQTYVTQLQNFIARLDVSKACGHDGIGIIKIGSQGLHVATVNKQNKVVHQKHPLVNSWISIFQALPMFVTYEERLEEDVRVLSHVLTSTCLLCYTVFRDQCRMFYISLLERQYLNIK